MPWVRSAGHFHEGSAPALADADADIADMVGDEPGEHVFTPLAHGRHAGADVDQVRVFQ